MFRYNRSTDRDKERIKEFIEGTMKYLSDIFFWVIDCEGDYVKLLVGLKENPELRIGKQFVAAETDSMDFRSYMRNSLDQLLTTLLEEKRAREMVGKVKYWRPGELPEPIIRRPLYSQRKKQDEEFISKEELPPLPNEELEVIVLEQKEGTWGKGIYKKTLKGIPAFEK